MPTIAFASSKGGTAKTSLCACLSVRAAQDSDAVSLVDLEPQHSLSRWHEIRRQFDDSNNPGLLRLGPPGETAIVKVDLLKRAGAEWIFVDLPPGEFPIIEPGIAVADFVLVPVKASPIDLEAIDPIIELCEKHGKPYRLVLTMFDDKWAISKTAFPFLERKYPKHTLAETFGYRQAYVGAMVGGRTGPEYNKDRNQAAAAGKEVDKLWMAVRRLATAAAKRRA